MHTTQGTLKLCFCQLVQYYLSTSKSEKKNSFGLGYLISNVTQICQRGEFFLDGKIEKVVTVFHLDCHWCHYLPKTGEPGTGRTPGRTTPLGQELLEALAGRST